MAYYNNTSKVNKRRYMMVTEGVVTTHIILIEVEKLEFFEYL